MCSRLATFSYTLINHRLPPAHFSYSDPSFCDPCPGHFAHGSDRHMISLEDVFQKFPRTPMCLEIKERNEELIHKVVL